MRLGPLARRVGRRLPPGARRLVNLARGIETPALVDRPPGDRVVVVAPHPDDELIGCGGTLRKHVDARSHVTVVFLTSGERTAGGTPPERREAEARRAAQRLGLGDEDAVRFLRLRDGAVGDDPSRLEQTLGQLRPDLVYAPFPVDAHRDHVAATRLLARCLPESVDHVALYEVWTPLFPNCIVDVGRQLDVKLDALACYESALAGVDYLHTVRGLAAYRSAQGLHGRGYAEAFLLLTPARLRELLK